MPYLNLWIIYICYNVYIRLPIDNLSHDLIIVLPHHRLDEFLYNIVITMLSPFIGKDSFIFILI